MARLTTNTLRARWHGADRWISDGGARGAGRLVARITREGVDFYFQYFNDDGRKRFFPLGAYDAEGVRGLKLSNARDKAAELSILYRGGVTDVHAHFERLREAEEGARKAAEEAARQEREAAQRTTLKQLLEAYVAHLERQGKQSARDARGIFERHVFDAAPDLSCRKAAEVPVEEFVGRIGDLIEAGKGRTAAKLRSYLRAAFALALRARTDPAVPLTMRSFGISVNPIAGIGALAQYNRTRDRVLSATELAAFIKRLEALPEGAQKDALRLCIILGGQRPAQLLRARPVDVDLPAASILLFDAKGARQQPRRHVVPLVGETCAILKKRVEALNEGEPLFSTDRKNPVRAETLSNLVADLARQMVEVKEAREPFQLRDVRRTAETMLASLGVSSDVRAQLQSHGLGGVQQRHYDRHDYMEEKRQALQKWVRHLDRLKSGKAADVVPIPRKGQL